MNDNEKDRIAAAISQLRPDWPLKSVRTLLDSPALSSRPRRDMAVALAWVACESQSKTPARVIEAGPWWLAAAAGDGKESNYRPPRKDEECKVHLGNYADACRGCAADRAAGDTTEAGNPRRPDRSDEITRLRAELAEARAHLCRHGIYRAVVRCEACQLAEKTATETTASKETSNA